MKTPPDTVLRRTRLEAGFSQIELSLKTGKSLTTIRLAERGIASLMTLEAVAKALGVEVSLFGGPCASGAAA